MTEDINVALVGLGRIGSQFATSLARQIDQRAKAINIVAVAEQDPNSETAQMFADDDVPVYTDAAEIVELSDEVDIIFDLTGVPSVPQDLRDSLEMTGNRHTVVVPEVVARLLWEFLEEGVPLLAPIR